VGFTGGFLSGRKLPVSAGPIELGTAKVVMHRRRIFVGEAGLLGNPLLCSFVVTLDPAGGRLLLERTAASH
jgi:hypothetical protein